MSKMKVILISGEAGAGKDTVAGFAKEILEERGEGVLITHYADLVKYICKNFLGWNGKKDKAGRELLQKVGTDVFRKRDPDKWVRFIAEVLEALPNTWDVVLIPDCRFPNELNYLKERGFDTVHVRVDRPNLKSALTEEQKRHASETAMKGVIPDYVIVNNEAEGNDLSGLKESVKVLLKECLGK